MPSKKISSNNRDNSKKITSVDANLSADKQTLVWSFDKTDRNDHFRFCCDRDDMQHDQLLSHIMEYSKRTWASIKLDTHDKGNKSKHHFLDYDELSACAKARVAAMHIEDDIYSLALTNKLRIIGIRDGRVFRAIWFDPEHEFCPSKH